MGLAQRNDGWSWQDTEISVIFDGLLLSIRHTGVVQWVSKALFILRLREPCLVWQYRVIKCKKLDQWTSIFEKKINNFPSF